VIRPKVIAEKLCLEMKYGRNIVTQENLVDCKAEVLNVPAKDQWGFIARKGKADALDVSASLMTQVAGQKKVTHPLRWTWVADRPILLPKLPNDGLPVPLSFLQIRLDDHSVMIAGSPDETKIRYLIPAEYELWLKVGDVSCYLGKFNLPKDLVSIAEKLPSAQYAIQSGGYVAYLEKADDGNLVLNCEGTITDGELDGIALRYAPTRIQRNGKPFDRHARTA